MSKVHYIENQALTESIFFNITVVLWSRRSLVGFETQVRHQNKIWKKIFFFGDFISEDLSEVAQKKFVWE